MWGGTSRHGVAARGSNQKKHSALLTLSVASSQLVATANLGIVVTHHTTGSFMTITISPSYHQQVMAVCAFVMAHPV